MQRFFLKYLEFRLWRSAGLGWIVVALGLIGGVPLFLCLPPWVDVTMYDVAACNILQGGVHYRDLFDTNLPGIIWIMAAIRATCGWSYEVLRAWDLAIVATISSILLLWIRRLQTLPASLAWFAAGIVLFYPFTSEFSHCQRDIWMLLPGTLASWLKARRLSSSQSHVSGTFFRGFLEGVLWGCAVWIKPHVVVPALVVWIASAIAMKQHSGFQRILLDFLGLVSGGLFVGGLGVGWLIQTGAWPYFLEIATQWNPEYTAGMWEELPFRYRLTVSYFPPWSALHVIALPIAVNSLVTIRQPERDVRGILAALYVGWMLQALFLQKGFDYVHVPEVILAMAVLAARGWSIGFPFLVWYAILGVVFLFIPPMSEDVATYNNHVGMFRAERHQLTDPLLMKQWSQCVSEGSTPELRDKLGTYNDAHCGVRWKDLDAVARYLETVDPPIKDGELTCFHDSTHSLYLRLNVKPSTRYMHFGTVFTFRSHAAAVGQEVANCKQRYVVSDLNRMTHKLSQAYMPGSDGNPNALPRWLPVSQRDKFPWNQPIVFREGRYIVHRIENPIGIVDVPAWGDLDKLGPGQ